MSFIADVEIVVGVRTAGHARHTHIGPRNILHKESLDEWVDTTHGNLIVGKLSTRVGVVGWAGGESGVVAGISGRGFRVVDKSIAHAEIALELRHCRNCKDLCVSL